MRSGAAFSLLVLMFFGASHAIEAESYTFTPISLPSGISGQVEGINDSGQIVGSFLDGVHPYQGFLYDHGTFSVVNFPGGTDTEIQSINNSGQMTGWYGVHGFLYSGGAFTTLDFPGAARTEPLGINSAGIIAGNYLGSDDRSHGFLYDHGVFSSITTPLTTGFVVDGINDTGQILGHQGILNPDGTFTPLHPPGAETASKFGFNNAGLVVGSYSDSTGMAHGFLYNDGVFTTVDVPGSAFPYGTFSIPAINNVNDVVADAYLGVGKPGIFLGVPTEIPEPGSVLLAAAGLLCGVGYGFKRRQSRSY
jgi:uncharacterized membrane protein